MMRMLRFILQVALVLALALWLSDKPGTAQIVWHDTVIETSAAFLAVCVVALAYALHLLFRIWHFLRNGPANWRLRRKLDKARKGQSQLTQGLIAIASGNATEAGRLAIAARRNTEHNVVALWLQAQAAQLAGDKRAAQEIFRLLAADEDAAILGYRGLINEAKRAGNWAEVDHLLGALQHAQPATPWLSLMRMESAARRGDWVDAESALTRATSARLLDSETGKRTRAALRVAISRHAALAQDDNAALQAAEQAVKQSPHWLPAVINLADILARLQHKRAALRVIERTWKTEPHPQLAAIVRRMEEDSLSAFRQTERVCKNNEDHIESRKALARAALDANIWGEARRHLLACVNQGNATQDIYKMLARLEKGDRNNERASSEWLAKASDATPDPVWLCRSCGGAHEDWQPVCGFCGSLDTMEWQSAGKSRSAVPYMNERGFDD